MLLFVPYLREGCVTYIAAIILIVEIMEIMHASTWDLPTRLTLKSLIKKKYL